MHYFGDNFGFIWFYLIVIINKISIEQAQINQKGPHTIIGAIQKQTALETGISTIFLKGI